MYHILDFGGEGGIGHFIPAIYNNPQQNNYAVSICQRVSQW